MNRATEEPPQIALAPELASERSLLDDCVHCGFCLPACPTYVLWGQEADSPRGRVYLMKLDREGRAVHSQAFVRHFDTCLGCMACVSACPSGVQYDLLLAEMRPRVERRAMRPLTERAFRSLIFALFPHPHRLRWFLVPLWAYQRFGLQALVRSLRLDKLFPPGLRAMERLMPSVSLAALHRRLPREVPAKGTPRRRVGLLLGCVQRVFFGHIHEATVRVLASEGCEVIVPDQECCGALAMHAGRDREAAAAARRLIAAFERAGVDTVAVNAAGCGSSMKEYGHLLRNDPEYAARARAFAAKCKDVSELLAELEPRAPRHALSLRVAYHDACHLQHAQGVRLQPRQLLKAIPDLEVREIAEPEICCGSAGIYNLLEPEAAGELRDRKVRNLLRTEADLVVSSNPGCILQIASGLQEAGRSIPIAHLVELVDASISGEQRWERRAMSDER